MYKFTFTSSFVPDQLDRSNIPSKITLEFEADSLDQILGQFTEFLRGSGFYFDGRVDLVDDEIKDNKPLTDTEAKGKFYVDPPSGWKYGFPRPYDIKNDGPLKDFLIKNGYPEKDATWASNNARFFRAEAYEQSS